MMGCDIHIVLERREKGEHEWIGLWCSDRLPSSHRLFVRQRDYGVFGRLAHVRHSPQDQPAFYDKNLPKDVSKLAWSEYIRHGTDHHSASHLSVADFCACVAAENKGNEQIRPKHAEYDLFGVDGDDLGEYRVVFWFDN